MSLWQTLRQSVHKKNIEETKRISNIMFKDLKSLSDVVTIQISSEEEECEEEVYLKNLLITLCQVPKEITNT